MVNLLSLVFFFLALHIRGINGAVVTDPVQGTSTFSIVYEFSDNDTPDNSVIIELDRPAGGSNRGARLTYTVNYRIAPFVPGAALTNEVSFNIGTTNSDVLLSSETAPISGTAATSDVVAGVATGSALVSLGSDLVIEVSTVRNSNSDSAEGSFTGFVTYTVELADSSSTSGFFIFDIFDTIWTIIMELFTAVNGLFF